MSSVSGYSGNGGTYSAYQNSPIGGPSRLQQQQAAQAGPSRYAQQGPAYGGTPRNQSSSNGSIPPIGSPQEIENSRNTARKHYIELSAYLNGKDLSVARSSAREKLTRLTRQQFLELSVDVYDELMRRKKADMSAQDPSEPYLYEQKAFHPKRNQARQKLATLATSRYKDLASDVYFELERRYPEFKEEDPTPDHIASYAQPSQLPARLGSISQQRDQQHSKQPSLNASSSAANEILVPNKSTLVEEEIPRPSLDAPIQPRYSNESDQRTFTPPPPPGAHYPQDGHRREDSRNGYARRGSETSTASKIVGGYSSAQAHEEEMDKLRQEYEYKITQLSDQVKLLERSKEGLEDVRKDLENKLNEAEEDLKEQSQRDDQQARQLREMQDKISNLQSQLQQAQSQKAASSAADMEQLSQLRNAQSQSRHQSEESEQIVEELRNEVKSLLEELKSLNVKYEDSEAERQAELDAHREEMNSMEGIKKKYEQSKTELRNMKATSQLFVQAPARDDFMPPSEDGVIADIHVTAFQSSIDALLQAARSQVPTSVLKATNAIVESVTQFDQDVQAFEARSLHAMDEQDRIALQSLKARCNATLSNLITAAKTHAASQGLSPVSLLDAAASHLTATAVDMIKLLKIRKASSSELTRSTTEQSLQSAASTPLLAYQHTPKPNDLAMNTRNPQVNGNNLHAPRSPPAAHSRTQNHQREPSQEDYFGNRVYEPDPSPAQPPSASYMSQWRPQTNGRQYDETPPSAGTGQHDLSPVSQGRDSPDTRDFDSPNRGEQQNDRPIEQGPLDEADWQEFRAYLENQTEAIVHSIQALLAAIRNGAPGAELEEHLTEIVTIVSSVVAISRDNLPEEFYERGDDILAELAGNCDKLSELQGTTGAGTFTKPTKQAVASASFAIARSLKQLNLLLADDEGEDLR